MDFLAQLWGRVKTFWLVLFDCWFSAFVVIALNIVLWTSPGQDLLFSLDRSDSHLVWFMTTAWLLAATAWYWSRVALDLARGRPLPKAGGFEPWLLNHVPRMVGSGFLLLLAINVLFAAFTLGFPNLGMAWAQEASAEALQQLPSHSPLFGLGIGLLISSALFYLLVYYRRIRFYHPEAHYRHEPGETGAPIATAHIEAVWEYPHPLAFCTDLPRVTRLVLALSVTLAIVMFVLVLMNAVAFGWHLGPGAVVFMAGANIIPIGSLIGIKGRRYRLPFMSALIVLALTLDYSGSNHRIRTIAGSKVDRPKFADAVRAWPADRPLVLVATAGGGSRAAYWTAYTLGYIQDQVPEFRDRLFAISSVSGGSIGAAVFVGLLASKAGGGDLCRLERTTENQQATLRDPNAFADCGRSIVAQDFLSPLLSGALYPDLAQRFLPVWRKLPDRAKALEEGFERAWAKSAPAGSPAAALFAAPFLNIWSASKVSLPALLLNSTIVETGGRIIVSNLSFDNNEWFHDTVDAFGVIKQDIPYSTAADLSARFPYLAPAGIIVDGRNPAFPVWGHAGDGGYFENFGATTAAEVLRAVAQKRPAAPKVIVIQISSDPEYSGPLKNNAPPIHRPPYRWGEEIVSPIETLWNTRSARGLWSAETLQAFTPEQQTSYFALRMCLRDGEQSPPLSWALSEKAQNTIDAMIDRCDNKETLSKLIAALKS